MRRSSMNYYQIAGINICVLWENEEIKYMYYRYHDCIVLPRALAAFHNVEIPEEPDMIVKVHALSVYTGPKKYKKLYNQSFYPEDDKMTMTVYDPYSEATAGYSITMSKDYSYVEFTPHISEYEHYDLQWMMHPFEGRVLYKGGIVLHGAAIECNGKGIIFTGISGAGKSTQAHLWQKYRDALIINGDCPSINMVKGIPTVYGTPWCGTSGEFINRKVTLSAVVLVKQGEMNTLKELEGHAAFVGVLANVLHSNFDESALDLSVENLKSIMDQIRVFEITCTISEEAVKILEREIM
jgi:hypothetical protein